MMTNTFCNFDKYILQFCQIHFEEKGKLDIEIGGEMVCSDGDGWRDCDG